MRHRVWILHRNGYSNIRPVLEAFVTREQARIFKRSFATGFFIGPTRYDYT